MKDVTYFAYGTAITVASLLMTFAMQLLYELWR
jgi:hypothetical protein